MLEIFIDRYKEIYDGTLGKVKVVFNGELVMECFSLEPAGPDTIESGRDRRIPEGVYRLSRWVSKKYPKSLLVHNEVVPKERAILIHNGNIVLGMQTPNRWYTLEDGTKAGIIKTIGGKIEKEDNGSSRNAVQREIIEEIEGINKEN